MKKISLILYMARRHVWQNRASIFQHGGARINGGARTRAKEARLRTAAPASPSGSNEGHGCVLFAVGRTRRLGILRILQGE